nr:AAA family ATPase [uncultured Devosia sp.]
MDFQNQEEDVASLTQSKTHNLNSRETLGDLALSHALNKKTRSLLTQPARVVIVQAPSADWAELLEDAVAKVAKTAVVKVANETVVTKGVEYRVGQDALHYLQKQRSIIYVSHDPDTILDEVVRSAADGRIVIPKLSPALLRKAISHITQSRVRGVTDVMAGLPLTTIASAIRPGLTARSAVANLARAIAFKPASLAPSYTVPLLHELPITARLRAWTNQTLIDLASVKEGGLAPSALSYATFEGAPGLGKTLVAESLARTANWSFVSTSAGQWFTTGDGALGGVARNVKSFVDEVMASEPCVGFLDEIDSVPDRATMDNRGRDWWTPIVNLILVEIDRVRRSGKRVMLVAGTNHYSRLDKALVRAGRLEQRVSFVAPQNEAEVLDVLRFYLRDDLMDDDLSTICRLGLGASPAQLEGWVKEARSIARSADRAIHADDLRDQVAPDDNRSTDDIRVVAVHEVGHALVAHRLGHEVEHLSIIAEGASGGHTTSKLPSLFLTLDQVRDVVTIMLAGRAADMAIGKGAHGGAEQDLEVATRTLLAAYEKQGLKDTLLYVRATRSEPSGAIVNAVAQELEVLLERAIRIVSAERELALSLIERLISARVLSKAQVRAHLTSGLIVGPDTGHCPAHKQCYLTTNL